MANLAKGVEEVDIISSIPGIGKATALSIVSEFRDIRRFSTFQKMNAFAGIDIRFNDSGQLKTSGFITKRGNGVLRKILYNAVMSMKSAVVKNVHSKNYVIDWYNRRSRNVKIGKKK